MTFQPPPPPPGGTPPSQPPGQWGPPPGGGDPSPQGGFDPKNVNPLNWGIVGITNGDTNVLSSIFGSGTLLNVVYVLVGVSALVFVPRLMEAFHIRGAHPRGV